MLVQTVDCNNNGHEREVRPVGYQRRLRRNDTQIASGPPAVNIDINAPITFGCQGQVRGVEQLIYGRVVCCPNFECIKAGVRETKLDGGIEDRRTVRRLLHKDT
jgi:hypothetical protein